MYLSCFLNVKLKPYIITFLFIAISAIVFGQEQVPQSKNIKFKHYSLTEGLSQSSVLCILQDTKGFFWFGTRDGLNKYDGHTFTTYRHNSKDSNSLSNSFIKSLFEDENGHLWVGTMNGLNKYIPEIDGFKNYKYANTKTFAKNRSNNEIWSIVSKEKGYLWLGTNYGLEKFNTQTAESARFLVQNSGTKSISNNHIRSLLITKDNNLWICNTNSIDVYNPKTKTFKQFAYPKTTTKEVSVNYAPVLYQDIKTNLWLGYKDGLLLFNNKSQVFEPYKLDSEGLKQINAEVRTIHQDHLGILWIGTYEGLYIVNQDKNSISHYVHNESEKNSLSQNSIYQIFEDSKGDVWIGTYAGGVNYYDRSFDLFKHFTAGTNRTKLSYNVVSAIVEDPERNLWIATEGGGINFYNRKTGLFDYYRHNENNPNSLSSNNVKSMIRTRKGNFWIGTHDGGLNFLNPKIKPFRFEKYTNVAGNTNSLSNNRVISLYEDDQNNIWIGTSGGGLNVMDATTKNITRVVDPSNTLSILVYNISKTASKDTLLIAGDKGLVKLNIKNHKFVQVEYKNDHNVYDFNATLFVYEDPSRNLWIATEGDGLYYYNSKSCKSVKYGIKEGLPNEVIYGILPVDSKTLWFSTNRGLSKLNLKTKHFKNIDVSDGLIGDEFNFGAFIKLENGNLMFGGTSGIDFFDPKKIKENVFIPPVSITGILVNNKPFLAENNSNTELTLKHNQNVFSFNFVALSYSQPTKNQYAYKLEGFDEDWNYIGNKKSATYTNLDAGEYIFKVKASNSDGLWNENYASVLVNIQPAPWKTWWAYLFYLVIILAVLWFIRRQGIIRIYEKNELKQERIEKEKLEEINQMKLRLFTNISHDFRTPLTLIIGPLERMLSQKLGNDFIQKQHEVMHRNASVLLQLINQLLDFRKSEAGKLKLNASKSNIVPYIKDIKLSFEELATVRQIDFTFIAPGEPIDVWFDKINLTKVIFNLLSNAFKFTPDGGAISIELSTVTKKQKLVNSVDFFKLVITDSGRGIPEKSIKAIFDRYYQVGEDENTRSGSGIGLALCKNVIKLHHGKIKVNSIEGSGTSFTVLLPIGKQHLKEKEINLEEVDFKKDSRFYPEVPHAVVNPVFLDDSEEDDKQFDENIPTLLLVEDNTEVRLLIKDIFKKDNNILEAANGEIALEIAKDNSIDLIISDVMMPIMDGVTLCQQIKSNVITSHIPVILLTAKTSEDSQQLGFRLGADAYITKPFDTENLKVRVANLLKLRRSLITKFRQDIILEPKELAFTSADELFLEKAVQIIEENISDLDFNVNVFTEKMNMSRSVIFRKLKALTDQSVNEFIRNIKLKRAAQYLVQTNMNISQITYEVGFNDLKYFRTCFKNQFKESPSSYRTKNTSSSK